MWIGLSLGLVALLTALPGTAAAAIFYQTGVGFRQPQFSVYHGDSFIPNPITVPLGGEPCRAPGSPDYLCGRLVSIAGNNGGRLFLKSAARFKRSDADPMRLETAAYADTRITITNVGGYVGTAPNANFSFGLGGTRSATTSNANVIVQAFASARLDAGTGGSVQCSADFDCGGPIAKPYVVKVKNWQPASGFTLTLRVDVAAVAPFGTPGGWDAEVVAEFADTLELLAIQLRDENDVPIPGVTLTALDNNGDTITFPNEPPVPTVTPTPILTPTPTPTQTAALPTPTARATPATVDHFMAYGAKIAKGTTPFVPLGPITLPRLAGGNYDVLKLGALYLPADTNGEGVHDDATHLLEYKIKATKDSIKFPPLSNVRVLNQCNDVFVQITKAVSVLVPTAKDLVNPVTAPVGSGVDHFLCFQAKAQKKGPGGVALPKFPKGIQVDVGDQFQIRRYELSKVSKVCLPTAKSGTPFFLKGAAKGQPAPLAPASVQHANEHLVCYKAKLASTRVEQLGCGPATPGDKGTKIVPKQLSHDPRLGVFIANQLGALRLDTTKEVEFCVPSFLELPIT